MGHAKPHPLARAAKKTIRRTRHAVEDAVGGVGQTTQALIEEGRGPVLALRRDAARAVRRHPRAAAGVVAGLFGLAGWLAALRPWRPRT